MARWLLGLALAVDLALMVILCQPITAPIVYEQTVKEEIAVVEQGQKKPGIRQDLREAMEAYNLQLSQDQSGLDSVDSYEAPGLNLEDYGMEADDAVGYGRVSPGMLVPDHLLSHSNSFGFEMEKDAAGCRALNRNFIVGECSMNHHNPPLSPANHTLIPWTYEEVQRSASLKLWWSRKRKRWECDNVYFWQDPKTNWSCRSKSGKYYYGFRSLRALLKSYVAGMLGEKYGCTGVKNVRANYHFTQNPKTLVCHVTLCCTYLVPPHVTEEFE